MESRPRKSRAKRRFRLQVPRWVEVVLAAVILSLVLTAAAVRGTYDLGPGKVDIRLRPQLQGETVVEIPPFGSIRADTHRAPAAVVLSPASVDPFAAQELVESRPNQQDLVAALRADLEEAFRLFALRLLVAGLVAGVLVAAIARAHRGELAAALGAGVLAPLILYAATFSGYNPLAFRQPTLTGALSRSPELLGPVSQFGQRFSALRNELDEIGSITFQLYQFLAEQSPIPADAIKVLHISDLHLNPVGYDVAQQVATRFDVSAVIDSGDATAEGTAVEVGFLDRIRGFDVPYFFVRGNHDSADTQAAVAAQPNARVLDGDLGEVDDVTIFGIGDPLFTPDKTVEQPSTDEQRRAKRAFAERVEGQVAALEEVPDITVLHDPISARELPGRVPLVLHGHLHEWSAEQDEGTFILGVGSTGAAGLKSLAPDSESPISMQVLYLDRDDRRLLGYDRIDVRGPSQQFMLRRTVVSPEELVEPPAGESPTLQGSPTPSPAPS